MNYQVIAGTIIILLQLLDVYSTYEALKYRNVKEANPIARKFMDKLGILPGMLVLKLPFVIGILLFAIPLWAYIGIAVVYIAVVANNFKTLKRAKSR